MSLTSVVTVLGIVGGLISIVQTIVGLAESVGRWRAKRRAEAEYRDWKWSISSLLHLLDRSPRWKPKPAEAIIPPYERSLAERALAEAEFSGRFDVTTGEYRVHLPPPYTRAGNR